MRILQECNVIAWLAKKLRFLFRIITPNLKDQEALECISTNIAANMLGLGFAATPSGLKGMKRLQELNENKEEASDEMITFLVLNTAGVTLFPTTMIAIRQALGSTNPLDFLVISMISSIGSTILGLIMERLMRKKRTCSTT
ncbi:MAG: spore maturation protein [Erysipelotrichaceae bacterium]|nr:spore maturation protein [Erysipelotrichaceae bacterium]